MKPDRLGRTRLVAIGVLLVVMLFSTACVVSGHVYRGTAGDASQPQGGVQVQLYGYNGGDVPGTYLGGAVTDSSGNYDISIPDSVAQSYSAGYLLIVPPPGFEVDGAKAGEYGQVVWGNAIEFSQTPPSGVNTSTGNDFFLSGGPLMAEPGTFAFYNELTGYMGVTNTSIDQWNPGKNRSRENLVVRPGVMGSLIRFELANDIVSGAQVSSAVLRLYLVDRTNANPLQVAVYEVKRPWVDTEATWNQATSIDAWGLPGCNDTLIDRSADPVAVAQVPTAVGEYVTLDITSLVQQWVNDPASNHGLYVGALSNSSVGATFANSIYPGPDQRPRLTVSWELPE